MLYVSRLIHNGGSFNVGVVDTDDNVEQIVPRKELESIIRSTGIEIRGARRSSSSEDMLFLPFMPNKDAQWKAMEDEMQVSLHAYQGVIYNIVMNRVRDKQKVSRINYPVTVKLSNFGHAIGDYCFSMGKMPFGWKDNKTMFILDFEGIMDVADTAFWHVFKRPVKVDGASRFSGTSMHLCCVKLDLSKVQDDALARKIYALWCEADSAAVDYIIDNPARKQAMVGK